MTEKELFHTLGVGLGATVDQLLNLTSDDVNEDSISMHVGPLHIRRTYVLPEEIKEALQNRDGRIFTFTREQAISVCGLDDFLPKTMHRYYTETNDIYYPMHIMGIESMEAALEAMGC